MCPKAHWVYSGQIDAVLGHGSDHFISLYLQADRILSGTSPDRGEATAERPSRRPQHSKLRKTRTYLKIAKHVWNE
jgi:hypothetical protein